MSGSEQRQALLIGAASCDDPGLPANEDWARQVSSRAGVLSASDLCGSTVASIVDAPCRELQVRIARSCMGQQHDDVVALYYSGHGLLIARGDLYLTARDTELDVIEATAVSMAWVVDRLASSRSKKNVPDLASDWVRGTMPAFEEDAVGQHVVDAAIDDNLHPGSRHARDPAGRSPTAHRRRPPVADGACQAASCRSSMAGSSAVVAASRAEVEDPARRARRGGVSCH
jgi:hypothetical protein